MTKRRSFAALLFVAHSLLAACETQPSTPVEVAHAIDDVACEALSRCIGRIHDTDPLDVAAGLRGDCTGLGEEDEDRLEILRRGNVRVDETRLRNSRDDLRDCRLFSQECGRVFVGTLPDGAACLDGDECVSGSCSGSLTIGACGVCEASTSSEPLAALGESCATASGCLPIAGERVACSRASLAWTCALRVTVREGEGCETDDKACPRGTLCDSALVCSRPLAVGSTCYEGDNCVRGAYCNGYESTPGICKSVVLVGAGEACGPGASPDAYVFCESRSLTCDRTLGVCMEIAPAAVGEPCAAGLEPCEAGLHCDYAVNTCADALPIGSPCFDDQDCATDRCVYVIANSRDECAEPLPTCD